MPALRPGSFLSRVFGQKQERSLWPAYSSVMGGRGSPATFKPEQSLQAYGDNVWLYEAVNKITFEVARTQFRLRKVSANGEVFNGSGSDPCRRPEFTPPAPPR